MLESETYWLKEMTNIKLGHPAFTDYAQGGSQAAQDIVVPITDEFYVTTTNGTPNFSYLYADNGMPYASGYAPGKTNGWTQTEFVPWKQLWEGCDKNDSQFVEERQYVKNWEEVRDETGALIGYQPRDYYTRKFIDHAPFIFSANVEDPIALAPDKMAGIINEAENYGDYYTGVIWSPAIAAGN